ncbi:MAG TPA: alpha/beta fold hydrolase [Bacteroidales bacterium]|nr:alpha/beta fold hydrolase [Bacteroidales bacterium]HPM88468.1 alpha/beta fold hydrolase [Bacteroidales bacterium]
MKKISGYIFLICFLLIFPVGIISQPVSSGKDLLVYQNSRGKTKNIKSQKQWQKQRDQILESMQKVMGPLPDRSKKVPIDLQIIEEVKVGNVRRLKITFAAEANDRVPAYLLIPLNLSGKVPGILCLHQTTAIGKGEPAGLGGLPNLHYALELAQRGYVTLAPDYPNFGDYKFDPYGNGYQSATMKGILNHMAAVDVLQSLPEVDPNRIGCIGHSLGGHNSLFLAAFDKRIKAVVTSCGFNSFYKYYSGDLTGWSHQGYMPRIATVYGKDPSKMPFDFTGVLGAIAPRAVFINAPLNDSNFEVSGVHDCVNAALPVYRLLKAKENLIMMNPDAGHDFPEDIREAAYKFLDEKLNIE